MAQAIEYRDQDGSENPAFANETVDDTMKVRTAVLERSQRSKWRKHASSSNSMILIEASVAIGASAVIALMILGAGSTIADNPNYRNETNRRMATAAVLTPTAQAAHSTATAMAIATAAVSTPKPTVVGTPRSGQ